MGISRGVWVSMQVGNQKQGFSSSPVENMADETVVVVD